MTATTATISLRCDPDATRPWNASCDLLPGLRIDAMTLRGARRSILARLKAEHPNATHVEKVELPPAEAARYAQYKQDVETLERLRQEVPQRRLELAKSFLRLAMSAADAAPMLHISTNRLRIHLRPQTRPPGER